MSMKMLTLNMLFIVIIICYFGKLTTALTLQFNNNEFAHSFSHIKSIPQYKTAYFNQTIDHFSTVSYTKKNWYIQRYLFTDIFWRSPDGPIFFYTGNEGPIDSFWNNTGLMFDIAPTFGALIIFAEHRYYGKSLPYGNESFTNDGLRYLTMEQAVADFAVLVTNLKENVFKIPNNPVIAFGGSYGGMLTAYMKFKYPNILQGGIAASAPIYWIEKVSKSHPVTFFDDVTKDFENIDPKCPVIVKSAFAQILSLFNSGDAGKSKVASTFNVCNPMKTATDLRQLFGWARNAFVLLAMMDYPYPTNFMVPLPGWPVKVSCQKMLAEKDVLTALKMAVEVVYPLPAPGCHNIYQEYIYCADPTGCGVGPDAIAWDFQACTQMALPAGSNNVTDMFPPLSFTPSQLEDYCKSKYSVVPDVDWTRINFWGEKILSATNLVFSNGDLDPWRNGGVLVNLTDSLVAVSVKDGAHHLDLRSSNPLDPDSVKEARLIEQNYIKMWINEHWIRQEVARPRELLVSGKKLSNLHDHL